MKNFLFLLIAFLAAGSLSAQEITTVYPNSAKVGDQLSLQISGAGTHFTQASNIHVSLFTSASSINANSVQALSDNMLIADVSIPQDAQPGPAVVFVYNDIDGSMISQDFTITNQSGKVPKLTSISPASGDKGQTLDLTITGQHTSFTQASQLQLFFRGQASAIMVNQITAISDTEAEANITILSVAIPGFYSAGMYSEVDGLLNYDLGFRVNPGANDPKLVSISQGSGHLGQTLDLTITGANTEFTQGTGTVMVYFFNGATSILVQDANVRSATKIDLTLNIPNDPMYRGIYSVVVSDEMQSRTLVLDSSFTIMSVGFKEALARKEVSVYPSPAHDQFSIRYPGPVSDVRIMNSIGQSVLIETKDIAPEGEIHRINLKNYELPPGVYYVRFNSGADQLYAKIFIN